MGNIDGVLIYNGSRRFVFNGLFRIRYIAETMDSLGKIWSVFKRTETFLLQVCVKMYQFLH
jgi:hypothetical protein